jgi:hypothetical protein
MTTRWLRILTVIAGLLGMTLLGTVVYNSRSWVGRTFPGFFLMSNRVVASVSLPDWFALPPAQLFQHEVVAVDGRRVSSSEEVYAYVGALAPGTRVSYALRDRGGETRVETLQARPKVKLAVLVGPEGGFEREERAALLAKPFVLPICLGPRVMRGDTAAVAALALVNAALGDWR